MIMKLALAALALLGLLRPAAAQEAPPDEQKVRELVEKLDANDVSVRAQAEGELSALGEAVVPLLEKARAGASSESRARLEGIIGEVTLARRWLKDLSGDEQASTEAYTKFEQALRAKTLDRKQAVRILTLALGSESVSDNVRHNLYAMAERHKIVEIWPVLVQQVAREDQESNYASSYLQRLRLPPEAGDALLKVLPKMKNRSAAIQMLELVAKLKPDRAKLDTALQAMTEDGDDGTNYQVLNYITSGRLQPSLKTMIRFWRTGNRSYRQSYNTREAVLRGVPDDSVKELIGWLGSADAEDAALAADYVAKHKVAEAAVPLVEALQKIAEERAGGPGQGAMVFPRGAYVGPQGPVRPKLVGALRALGAEGLVKGWLAAGGPPSRSALVGLIGDLELRPLAGEVLAALEDKDPEVRRAAARVLASLPHADAAARLEARLKDENIPVRRAALLSFAQLRGPAATGTVLEQLRSDHADLQAAAMEVLPSMNVDLVLDELTKEAALGRPMTRYALAYLVVQQGDAMLHRVMARVGPRLSPEDLGTWIRLIQAARGR